MCTKQGYLWARCLGEGDSYGKIRIWRKADNLVPPPLGGQGARSSSSSGMVRGMFLETQASLLLQPVSINRLSVGQSVSSGMDQVDWCSSTNTGPSDWRQSVVCIDSKCIPHSFILSHQSLDDEPTCTHLCTKCKRPMQPAPWGLWKQSQALPVYQSLWSAQGIWVIWFLLLALPLAGWSETGQVYSPFLTSLLHPPKRMKKRNSQSSSLLTLVKIWPARLLWISWRKALINYCHLPSNSATPYTRRFLLSIVKQASFPILSLIWTTYSSLYCYGLVSPVKLELDSVTSCSHSVMWGCGVGLLGWRWQKPFILVGSEML